MHITADHLTTERNRIDFDPMTSRSDTQHRYVLSVEMERSFLVTTHSILGAAGWWVCNTYVGGGYSIPMSHIPTNIVHLGRS